MLNLSFQVSLLLEKGEVVVVESEVRGDVRAAKLHLVLAYAIALNKQ